MRALFGNGVFVLECEMSLLILYVFDLPLHPFEFATTVREEPAPHQPHLLDIKFDSTFRMCTAQTKLNVQTKIIAEIMQKDLFASAAITSFHVCSSQSCHFRLYIM